MVINLFLDNLPKRECDDHIIKSGANKNSTVINNGMFPRTAIEARAKITNQGGAACELPSPTWCQDSK
jgi:hypothetical protein